MRLDTPRPRRALIALFLAVACSEYGLKEEQGVLSVSPTSVMFDLPRLGEVVEEPIEVSNVGKGKLQIQSLEVSGPFELVWNTDWELEPGEIYVAPVTFEAQEGEYEGDIVIDSNGRDPGRVVVELGALVAAPDIVVDPLELRFEESGESQTVFVRNQGQGVLVVEEPVLSDGWSDCGLTITSLGAELEADEVGALDLECDTLPEADGILQIHSNDPDEPVVDVGLLVEASDDWIDVEIVNPSEGEVLPYEMGHLLTAVTSTSFDTEDVGVTWYSSLEGMVAEDEPDEAGVSTTTVSLEEGTHEITVVASGPDGLSAQDSVTVEVVMASLEDVVVIMAWACLGRTADTAYGYAEADALEAYLLDMGLDSTVLWESATGLDPAVDLVGTELVIYDDCGYWWEDINTQSVDQMTLAMGAGAAIFVLGDDAAGYTDDAPGSEDLILVQTASSNGASGDVVMVSDDADAPLVGAYGTPATFHYSYDIDTAAPLDAGERILARRGGEEGTPVWIVDEGDAVTPRRATLIAGIAYCDHGVVGSASDLAETEIVFKNTVAWLLGE